MDVREGERRREEERGGEEEGAEGGRGEGKRGDVDGRGRQGTKELKTEIGGVDRRAGAGWGRELYTSMAVDFAVS